MRYFFVDFIDKQRQVQDIVNSEFFDAEWYCQNYGLNIASSPKLAKHYLNFGWKKGYNPSEKFSSVGYLLYNYDVYAAKINPLLHYERNGKAEGRKLAKAEYIDEQLELIRQSEYFDASWYKKEYNVPDEQDPAIHYFLEGVSLYNNPSTKMSTMSYLIHNQQYIGGECCPIIHYEKNGKNNPNIVVSSVDAFEKSETTNNSYIECMYIDKDAKNSLLSCQQGTERPIGTVDIIICVYNAYEDVKRCIESVKENTSEPYRVIIIDDNSHEMTKNYLEAVAEEDFHVKLIRNESDLHGYTYAANIGLRASTADYVVLLNSDTIVSKRWIDNMLYCMQSQPEIGIVGPLSNTASWQSVPELLDDDGDWCHNVIPQGFSVGDVAEMIEENSKHLYPTVPLLNGFCLMIKRTVIEQIGYFDEENFGRGFAEEDDYCSRARHEGIKLAIADNTYVFHAQSKSYSDAKRLELCKISGEYLRKKHGEAYIENACKEMIDSHVIDGIRCQIRSLFERENIIRVNRAKYEGKKILILLPATNASGGANVIMQEAKCMHKMGIDITIANLEANKQAYMRAYGQSVLPVLWLSSYSLLTEEIVNDYDVVVCTIFHTVKYCEFLKEKSFPRVVYYIQDYEPYFLEENKGLGGFDEEAYQEAVKSYTLLPNAINVTKTEWNRNEVKKNTGAECKVIGPSVNVDLFIPRPKVVKNRLVITAMIRPDTLRRGPKMTMDVLQEVANKYHDLIEIRIFGTDPQNDFKAELFFKGCNPQFEFTNYGLLSPCEMAKLLAQSDIFVDLSTFQAMGLTAMEAMASGCATILPIHGGTGMFACNEENALVIDTLDKAANVEALERLICDKSLREKIARNGYRSMRNYYPEKVVENLLNAVCD